VRWEYEHSYSYSMILSAKPTSDNANSEVECSRGPAVDHQFDLLWLPTEDPMASHL
jgi:hypothetical protein